MGSGEGEPDTGRRKIEGRCARYDLGGRQGREPERLELTAHFVSKAQLRCEQHTDRAMGTGNIQRRQTGGAIGTVGAHFMMMYDVLSRLYRSRHLSPSCPMRHPCARRQEEDHKPNK